jgi:glycosyltransferase involved in cell wall biosynthesis
VLTVGAIQKRKNIARLVEAFEALEPVWSLVIAGSAGYGAEEILARIERSPARERIRVLGYLSDEDLGKWYSRADIFAFPSLDEGFGMPVLEAMSAGIPVLAAKRASLPEVCGDAALMVDGENQQELTQALLELSQNADLRERLAGNGRLRAPNFTWQNAAEQTWRVYSKLF